MLTSWRGRDPDEVADLAHGSPEVRGCIYEVIQLVEDRWQACFSCGESLSSPCRLRGCSATERPPAEPPNQPKTRITQRQPPAGDGGYSELLCCAAGHTSM